MPISVTLVQAPPTANLFLDALPTGTTTVWVWRVWAGREARVRGDDRAVVVGSTVSLRDYDVPVARPVQYRAQCWGADGTELAPIAATGAMSVAMADRRNAWISDPIAPAFSRLVRLGGVSDDSRTYQSAQSLVTVIGQRRPVAISGIRTAAGDWRFVAKAYSDDESTALESLFAGGGTLLVRAHPSTVRHNTGLAYLSAPTVTEHPRHDLYQPERTDWEFVGQEVRPPGLSVVAPLRTWADVKRENATWAEVKTKYDTWRDLLEG